MIPLLATAATMVVSAGLVLVGRARISVARRRTQAAVAAVRAELGIPADRCQLVEINLAESIAAALQPWRRLPRFEHVHRVPRQPMSIRQQP